MASYNKVLLMGNLTRNPEVRYTPAGTAVTDLGLAVNESFKNKAGEQVEQAVFVDVTCWGRQAETAGEFLSKGSPVFVDGKLQMDQWVSDSGEKRSKLRVRADRIQFLSGKPADKGNQQDNPPAPDPAPIDDDDVPF